MEDFNSLPIISIIVPVYKAENFISECIDSLINQSFQEFEVILINDGSPDQSGSICDFYASRDNRIKVIHKENGGASSARNVGIKAAVGKYIGWVDADDKVSPEMYSVLYNLSETHNADISECQYLIINGSHIYRSGEEEPDFSGEGETVLKEFFSARMKPSLCTKLYKRELWNNVVFPKGRIHQDCYINMRFALDTLKYVRTSKTLYNYIVREDSITTTHTSRELRQAIYLYEYTVDLGTSVARTNLSKQLLMKDAINRLIGRIFDVSVNSDIKNLYVYNHYIRKKLGYSLIKYLATAHLPFVTRISYVMILLNMKKVYLRIRKPYQQLKRNSYLIVSYSI
jgi:glycosyltransferase involved in cell wall biosynthesis